MMGPLLALLALMLLFGMGGFAAGYEEGRKKGNVEGQAEARAELRKWWKL